MINLVVVMPSMSKRGGAERVVDYLVRGLDPRAFSITLVTLHTCEESYSFEGTGIRHIDLGLTRSRYAFFKLFSLIRKLKPDVVFSSAAHVNLMLALVKRLSLVNFKLVIREVSLPSIMLASGLKSKVFKCLGRRLYSGVSRVICQSQGMQEDFCAFYAVPHSLTTIIGNPVNCDALKEMAASRRVTLDPDDAIHLMCVGRLSPEKGVARLIDAVEHLDACYTLTIVGDGPLEASLKAQVQERGLEDRIQFLGFVDPVAPYLARADLTLSGSFVEGFPNALLESISLGTPVVAFDCPGGTKDIVWEGLTGFLCPSDRIEDFVACIEKAAAYSFSPQDMSSFVDSYFAQPVVLSHYKDLLLAL